MLSDYLRKTDMMSMLNSVEYRVPLLDEDLTDLALSNSILIRNRV
ncbi:MAG: asparagine synthase-related protein [Ignavibacteria bacterium]